MPISFSITIGCCPENQFIGYLDELGIAYCGRYATGVALERDEGSKSGRAAATKALQTVSVLS